MKKKLGVRTNVVGHQRPLAEVELERRWRFPPPCSLSSWFSCDGGRRKTVGKRTRGAARLTVLP